MSYLNCPESWRQWIPKIDCIQYEFYFDVSGNVSVYAEQYKPIRSGHTAMVD
jgi:hypothetical protein